jgi:hypothetical protein
MHLLSAGYLSINNSSGDGAAGGIGLPVERGDASGGVSATVWVRGDEAAGGAYARMAKVATALDLGP